MFARDYREKARVECLDYSNRLAFIEFLLFIAGLVLAAIGIIPYVGAVLTSLTTLVIAGPLEFSYIDMAKAVKNKGEVKAIDIFKGFKRFEQALIVTLLTAIFTVLWLLLLIVPGVIKGYAYSMAKYIAHDDPKKSSMQAIKESQVIMYGYKWKLFCLQISYIGWFLLCAITLFIVGFWVFPKYRQAEYEFYLYVSAHPIIKTGKNEDKKEVVAEVVEEKK